MAGHRPWREIREKCARVELGTVEGDGYTVTTDAFFTGTGLVVISETAESRERTTIESVVLNEQEMAKLIAAWQAHGGPETA